MKVHGKWRLKVDRSFSAAQIRQFLWVVFFLFAGYFGFSLLNNLLPNHPVENSGRILDLLIDPGSFTGANSESSIWTKLFELTIVVFGAVIFTGVLISVISNMLDGRVNSFKAGELRYKFSDHILILGANKMLPNMIRDFMNDQNLKNKDIVIMTNRDVENVRSYLRAELDEIHLKNVVLLFGNRNSNEELQQLMAKDANCIYILGEGEELQHDSINVACYLKLVTICNKPEKHIKCFLVIENSTSYHILQFQKKLGDGNETGLQLTIINSLENWAQQVLVSRKYKDMVYPPIDRGGINHDSNKHVHFVVVGMTQMSLAMANTVAHIAHFPNFRTGKGPGSNKTRITFICPDIKQEMHFFKGHYSQPVTLSLVKYLSFDPDDTEPDDTPDERYGDFIDIEWEFIDGGIEIPQVRNLIGQWCKDESQILTMAVCGKDSTANTASALYLPDCVFEGQVPVFVYQPLMGEMLEQAHATKRYQNIYPFGMVTDCYDFSLRERLKKAKRINHIYTQGSSYVHMVEEDKLDKDWYGLSFSEMQSNIYAANSIPTKLRSIGISDEKNPGVFKERMLTDEEIGWLSECEQNRWNMEKLLVGFHALPRIGKDGSDSPDIIEESLKKFMQENDISDENVVKKEYFTHKNIRPYKDLDDKDKLYNKLMIRHLFDIIVS